jgi:hypothetical protein
MTVAAKLLIWRSSSTDLLVVRNLPHERAQRFELIAQRGQRLPNAVVQFAADAAALVFLRGERLRGKMAQQFFLQAHLLFRRFAFEQVEDELRIFERGREVEREHGEQVEVEVVEAIRTLGVFDIEQAARFAAHDDRSRTSSSGACAGCSNHSRAGAVPRRRRSRGCFRANAREVPA